MIESAPRRRMCVCMVNSSHAVTRTQLPHEVDLLIESMADHIDLGLD